MWPLQHVQTCAGLYCIEEYYNHHHPAGERMKAEFSRRDQRAISDFLSLAFLGTFPAFNSYYGVLDGLNNFQGTLICFLSHLRGGSRIYTHTQLQWQRCSRALNNYICWKVFCVIVLWRTGWHFFHLPQRMYMPGHIRYNRVSLCFPGSHKKSQRDKGLKLIYFFPFLFFFSFPKEWNCEGRKKSCFSYQKPGIWPSKKVKKSVFFIRWHQKVEEKINLCPSSIWFMHFDDNKSLEGPKITLTLFHTCLKMPRFGEWIFQSFSCPTFFWSYVIEILFWNGSMGFAANQTKPV